MNTRRHDGKCTATGTCIHPRASLLLALPAAAMPGANCSQLVPHPVDTAPFRSPQAVHSALASRFAGQDIVELGTRRGDGMACFAAVARRAVAVEMDPKYCRWLQARQDRLAAPRFGVSCRDYRKAEADVDGDIITWWQQPPHLIDGAVLRSLRRLQHQGTIRASAQAVVLFDTKFQADLKSFAYLNRSRGWIQWSEQVPFDERQLCCAKHKWRGSCSSICSRASGTFLIAGIPIQNVRT
ncbi:hypothetical protein AB1Y20_002396 [Prymnesium parvum]|uniref:rRNA adenine N(6)-methyltransferase n=1 Tax=Prymnesium parvum TaxID=97485 RepID=A0AB34JAJ1_PRYPA